ncbi:MAG: hypothetical protein WBN65_12705 [Gammaproteobacteria bacterium]
MTRFTTSALCLAVLLLACAPVQAVDDVFDTAEVIDVEPMLRRIPTQVTDKRCDTRVTDSRPLDGLYPGLAEAIDGESERQFASACREIRRTVYTEELSGYRVRYRYGDGEYERVMSHDPGDTLRVRVSITPGH